MKKKREDKLSENRPERVSEEMMEKVYISEIMTTFPEGEVSATEEKVYEKLKELGTSFERVDNDSISTMEECEEVGKVLGTEICKSILACTRNKSEYYLIIMPGDKRFVSKLASKAIGSSRLSFASPEDMKDLLGTTPGNASPLAVINDCDGKVKLVIDSELAEEDYIACNTGANTTHIRFRTHDLIDTILPAFSHKPVIVELPDEQ